MNSMDRVSPEGEHYFVRVSFSITESPENQP